MSSSASQDNHAPQRTRASTVKAAAFAFATVALLCAGCAGSGTPASPLSAPSGSYRMAELLPVLSNGFWEITPPHRAAFIAEQYPGGVPEDYVSLEGSGAQPDIQVLRLDSATLAVVAGTSRFMRFSDGDHQIGYDLSILRRTDSDWQDLTSAVFPFPIAPHSNAALSSDGTIVVTDEHRKNSKKYRFDGGKFQPDNGKSGGIPSL